ncbi:hypothetical protein O0L34_g2836 [Tuta absoluta]|nr:hypothetical protein O0L34_g2836 [Tuta absoluta]
MFNFKGDEPTKTLGLGWNTKEDKFCFNLAVTPSDKTTYTKRTLLSEISKIYDPLGWIAPVTIKAKLLFQNVWSENINWDEVVPAKIATEWTSLRNDMINIKNIYLPRWMNVTSQSQPIELHGYCDSSEKAYACTVYSRVINANGQYVTTLLAAKTKVAPLKKKTTLPRLELCGALLLAKLIEKVKTALAAHQLQVSCWTDSQVVLAWLQGSNTKWDKYITNRTTQITSIIPANQWRYVNTKENPADCATRGLLPSQLIDFKLWWSGPQWLNSWKESTGSQEKFSTDNERIIECCATQTQSKNNSASIVNQLIERCSSLTRVTRSLAWVLRCKNILCRQVKPADPNLTLNEFNDATTLLIKTVQNEHFSKDIESIKKTGNVSNKSKILNLSPYIDDKGLLKLGGRLHLSSLPEETKHPAILPHYGRLTRLVIEHAHKRTLHGGARVTLAQVRHEYWIVGGNRATKAVIRSCVRCHRFKTTKNNQIMGNLPPARITPSPAFTHCGVDYTGAVDVKLNRGRGVRTTRGYIAIFICMVTKAVHIELVSDLTSQAFIAALVRLCSRRGTPKHIYSDNGTNFRGAAKILHDEFKQYETMTSSEFFNAINEMKIEWHFLAPRWPTAAGVWEAAVKSMKFHLMRVMGNYKLDFEQLATLLTQIEACMNSRPLCPLTEDPEDLNYLTPGHFLTGRPMMSLPQENISERDLDIRNRWKIIELMHQHIWNRWSKEYLHQLQVKSKWLKPTPNLKKGDLVLVKEDNVPPGKWAMLIYINISTFWQGTTQITKYITALDDLCRRMEHQPCEPVNAQLKHELQQLQDYNKLLISPHLSRKKRGYINGVGNLARTLFGVLDEEFANKYEQDIETIQVNENYLLDLIKNQTSIVEAENEIIKNNERFMNQQLQSIHEYIQKSSNQLAQITHRVEIMTTMNEFNAASLTASMILSNLKRTQDMLLNTMMNLYNGHFDYHLLAPEQLILQLHMISAKVAKGLSLPVKNNNIEENIRELYQLLYVRARITSSFLLLEVHIPLTRDDEYKIYRPIALPMNIENEKFTSVLLSSSYIAVYLKSNEYLTLEDRDLNHCIQTNAERYVCNMIHPVISLRNKHAPCEVQVFNQQRNKLNCTTITKTCTETWTKLHKQNEWLCTCCNHSCQARILCDDRISTAKLTKVGILDLDEGCILQNKDTTVFAYNHVGNKLELNLDVPKIPDPTDLKINELVQINFTDLLPQTINVENNHENIDAKLKQLKQNENLPKNLSPHDIHQYSILYLLVGGLLIVGIYLIIRRCKERNENRNTTSHCNEQQRREPRAAAAAAAARDRVHRERDVSAPQPHENIEMRARETTCDVCPPIKKTDKRFSIEPY